MNKPSRNRKRAVNRPFFLMNKYHIYRRKIHLNAQPMKSILFFLPFLFTSGFLSGQNLKPTTEITIDHKTHLPDKLSPFDEHFILNIPVDSTFKADDIRALYIYRATRKKLRSKEISTVNLRINSYTKVKQVIHKPYQYRDSAVRGTEMPILDVESKTGYTNVKTLVPPLIYNKNYFITIQYALPQKWADTLEKVNDLISTNSARAIAFANITYNRLFTFVEAFSASHNSKMGFPAKPLSFKDYQVLFNKDVAAKFSELSTALNTDTEGIQQLYKTLFDTIKKCVACHCLTECSCDEKALGEAFPLQYPSFLLSHCCVDKIITDKRMGYLASTRACLADFLNPTAMEAEQATLLLGARMSKLQADIDFLAALRKLYFGTAFTNHVDCDCKEELLKAIDALQTKLKSRQKKLKLLLKSYQDGLDLLITHNDLDLLKVTDLRSDVADLKTLSGNFIIPEFGLAGMFPLGNANPGLTVRPYYGVNISFRPINKNIRFRDIPDRYWRNLWYRTSLTLGLTYWALNKNRTDIRDLLDDTSPLVGLNFRCSRAFRVGGGVIVYHQHAPNPLLKDVWAAMPYVCVSLDVDVVSFMGKLSDRIFK